MFSPLSEKKKMNKHFMPML